MEGKQLALYEDLRSKGAKGTEWSGQVFSIYQKWPNSVLVSNNSHLDQGKEFRFSNLILVLYLFGIRSIPPCSFAHH